MSTEPRDSFLTRWARLKRETAKAPEPAPEPPPPEDEETRAAKAKELEERLAALPKLEDIGPETDVTVFLQDWVPHALRNAALRRVWSSDPRITDFMEVADYQLDWNTPGGAPGYGPLEPGFDAQAHLRRVFREVIPEDVHDRDGLSQASADANATDHDAAVQHDLASETPESDPEINTKVVHRDAIASAAPAEAEDAVQQERPEQPRVSRRRHGGALPEKAS
jgi:hypothetical protein